MAAILKQGRRDGEVERRGYLERPVIAGDDANVPTDPFHEPGIVGGGCAPGVSVCALKHFTKEPLRGLNATQRLSIRSVQHATLGVDHLDGVGHRESGNDGRMACTHAADDPFEQIRRRKTPGNVVNQHDPVVVA